MYPMIVLGSKKEGGADCCSGIGPENKKKERPRGGRSHGDTGRDDKI